MAPEYGPDKSFNELLAVIVILVLFAIFTFLIGIRL